MKNIIFQSMLNRKQAIGMLTALLLVFTFLLSACSGYPAPGQAARSGFPNTGVQATPASTVEPTMQMNNPATEMPAGQVAGNPATTRAGLKAYIGLFKDNAVAVLDTTTNRVLRTISVPTGPHGLVISPDGRWVYVSSDGDSKVSVIDTTTDRIVDTIEVGKNPHGLAITPDGQIVLAAVFGTSQVVFIYTPQNIIIDQVSVPNPHNIAISPDGHTAYVAAQKQGSTGLAILDVDRGTQVGFIPLDKTPRALNFSPDGKWLYFTQSGVDAVQVLDPATNLIANHIPVGASPHHPLFTPDGKAALVVSQGPGQLSILDPLSTQVSKVVTVGKMPHWIAVNPQGTVAWVTNEGSNDVSVVDITTGKVTATIPVGGAPRKIVVQGQMPPIPLQSKDQSSGFVISIQGMAFMDAVIHVKAGQQVTWNNQDSIAHTVTSDQGLWDSGNIEPGKSYSLKLDKPGQYSYHCSIHPFMTGKIIVTP
ncbi:MAG: cupredoxin domain-containing protein [Omnitrophica WOR_2 bacterium]